MNAQYREYQTMVENRLNGLFLGGRAYARLNEAMRYSVLSGGKRVRPVLVLAFCRAAGGDIRSALDAACGVELLHTYSLIHDDLPCMDNDDLRRGKPTNHVVFGETTAVLAGDALQAEAFRLLLGCPLPPERIAAMAGALAKAAGLDGICGGQALDIDGEGKDLSLQELTEIHRGKTASLLIACAEIGCYAAGAEEAQLRSAREYAANLGLAFQIQDDLLDAVSTTEELGKPVGSDAENGKRTFAALYGAERCRELVEQKTAAAIQALKGSFESPDFLIWLAESLAHRTK